MINRLIVSDPGRSNAVNVFRSTLPTTLLLP